MQPRRPVQVIDLFPEERQHLIEMLSQLGADDWSKATSCPGWSVKDIAAHILGDDLNNLSGGRDGYREGSREFQTWTELVAFINDRNEDWVRALRRLSPRLLMDLLGWTGARVFEFFASVDPSSEGPNVAWAGEGPMPYWLHIAREYTERWVHQQQIRDAVGVGALTGRRYLYPVLDTFAHALPRTYRHVEAPEGTEVDFVVTGEAGGQWPLVRALSGWLLVDVRGRTPAATVTTDADVAWRMFTRGMDREDLRGRTRIEGDEALGYVLLDSVAIIA
jgi:uncharacterized protein (TIGR03083 family)